MKNKIRSVFLAGLLLTSLAGCASVPLTKSEGPIESTVSADAASAEEPNNSKTAEESKPESTPVNVESKPAEKEESVPAESSEPASSKASPEPVPSKPEITPQTPVQNPPPKEPESSSAVESTKPVDPPSSEEPKPPTPPAAEEPPYVRPSTAEVEKAVAKYINEYRLAQGDTAVVVLPGLTEVARYRANQLITNFSHESDPDACTVLKYGELVDMTELGYSEEHNYYRGYNREAAAKGNWTGTADEIGQKIAAGFQNSTGHWAYVGSSEYGYMAVGITFNPSDSHWYCCICMSSQNYGG